jgi:hypothetical protein
LPEKLTSLQEKESALETQSGFMIVLKGKGDSLTLSVRRRVGTPPNSSVSLTPDEVRHLTNLLSEVMPQAKSEKVLVGAARPKAEAQEVPELSSLDLFIEKEYPSLAKRKKRTGQAKIQLPTGKKAIAFTLAIVAVPVLFLTASLIASQKGKPAKSSETIPSEATVPDLDAFARDFVLSMLDFKSDTYRTSQVKAMSMMVPALADKYWKETNFPLSKMQLKTIPADQEVRIETIKTVKSDENYRIDVFGGVVTGSKEGSKSMPMHIQLVVKAEKGGKLLVLEQKDLSATEPLAKNASDSSPEAEAQNDSPPGQ